MQTPLTTLFVILGLLVFKIDLMFGDEYILYVRARSSLGKELSTYWKDVKEDSSIRHKALIDYPPHCSLTGFFPKDLSKQTYIDAVRNAMKSLGSSSRTITVVGLVQGNQKQKLDYIKLSSSFLLKVTKTFMDNASVPQQYLKDPQTFPYHITLRNTIFSSNAKKRTKKIQSLENKINLSAKANWSLFLYKRDTSDALTLIEEFPL
jgi:hypothetical protein